MSVNTQYTANAVKEWMQKQDMTNVELAQILGISESLVRALLKGERRFTPSRIEQLIDVTSMSRNELLGISQDEEYADFSVMLRGSAHISEHCKNEINKLALLFNDYETLKSL